MIKYAHDNALELYKWSCHFIDKNKDMEMLKIAHENGCELDEWICRYAS